MINTLDDYIRNSLPDYGDFATNPNLTKKVDTQGHFLPFRGNTTVFLLSQETKTQLRALQRELYEQAGGLLSDPLEPDTFHMTLHDLVNGSPQDPTLPEKMAIAEARVKALLAQWRDLPPLRMKTTRLFNMVNTSIVLGLRPADAESWRRLDELYLALEAVVPLGYGLTPHITMAYFRPGTYSQEALLPLRGALQNVEPELELPMENLVFQTFEDMNHYETE